MQMIEQGLHLLGLHIIWKAQSLPDAKDMSVDSNKLRETLREQRDSLLEKLVEYAVGTQSNTAEGVKRAVSPLAHPDQHISLIVDIGFPKFDEPIYLILAFTNPCSGRSRFTHGNTCYSP